MIKKIRPLPLFLWTSSIFWVLFIFINSMQPGRASGQMSSSVTETINRVLHTLSPSLEVSNIFVRKMAHFGEFAILGLFLCFSICSSFIFPRRGALSLKRISLVLLAFPFSVAVAAADETIQLFADGRVGSPVDVMIDSSGAAFATLMFFLILLLLNRIGAKKNNS